VVFCGIQPRCGTRARAFSVVSCRCLPGCAGYCYRLSKVFAIEWFCDDRGTGHLFMDAFYGIAVGVCGDEDDRYAAHFPKPPTSLDAFATSIGGVSVPPNANASMPSPTPADLSAGMADGGSGHADTSNSCPTRAACVADLRGHPVRLMKRRECHCLRRRCED
jgi:hypothetical protein